MSENSYIEDYLYFKVFFASQFFPQFKVSELFLSVS